jgi:hypothetical protein
MQGALFGVFERFPRNSRWRELSPKEKGGATAALRL